MNAICQRLIFPGGPQPEQKVSGTMISQYEGYEFAPQGGEGVETIRQECAPGEVMVGIEGQTGDGVEWGGGLQGITKLICSDYDDVKNGQAVTHDVILPNVYPGVNQDSLRRVEADPDKCLFGWAQKIGKWDKVSSNLDMVIIAEFQLRSARMNGIIPTNEKLLQAFGFGENAPDYDQSAFDPTSGFIGALSGQTYDCPTGYVLTGLRGRKGAMGVKALGGICRRIYWIP